MDKKYFFKFIILLVSILLFYSCGKSPKKALEILENNKISFSPDEFVYRARIGDLDTLKLFIIAGMSPDTTDSCGLTPLISSLESENIDMIQLLLDSDIDINKPDSCGNTALIKAILKSDHDIINLILSKNPDVNICNNIGETPLILSAMQGKKKILDTLLNLGANINQVDNKGWTPLMYASFNGHFDIVNILVEHKADLDLENDGGQVNFRDCPNVVSKISVSKKLSSERWVIMDNPLAKNIWDIEIVSSSEAWAVTVTGSILYFNGTEWSMFDNFPEKSTRGLCMLSSDLGWAVGCYMEPTYPSFILHYKNQNWTMVEEPAVNHLWDVDFFNEDVGWAVGQGILRYNGNKWETFATYKELDLDGTLWSIDMVSENEGWAVGDSGLILYYNGSNWSRVNSPVIVTLSCIEMCSASDGWIVGWDGTILRYDGSEWNIIPSHTNNYLYGVTVTRDGDVFAAGHNILLYFNGNEWIEINVQFENYFRDIDFGGDDLVMAVGDDGMILRRELMNTNVPPPNIPQIDQIDNEDGNGNFTVCWKKVTGFVRYILEEADESLCPKVIYFGTDRSKEIFRKNVGRYYYRVKSIGVGGQSDWSMIKSVKVNTPPPACALECTGSDQSGLNIKITCESGRYTSSMRSMRGWDEGKGWVTYYSGTRTYEESGNIYKIEAQIWSYASKEGPIKVAYSAEVSGGAFGETPRICSSD
ncbi:MAG: ankyrin repeat domain-containing protein [Promethearchaeota archaeon]